MNKKLSYPILDSLKEDIEFYNDSILEIASEILNNSISEYPIFVAHQHDVELGNVILDKSDFNRTWTINATIVEELLEKKIISNNKFESFKGIYKDPRKHICVFLISEKGGNFVFIPYKKIKQ